MTRAAIAVEPSEILNPDEAFDEDLDGDGVEDVPVGFGRAVVEATVVDAWLVEFPVLVVEDPWVDAGKLDPFDAVVGPPND